MIGSASTERSEKQPDVLSDWLISGLSFILVGLVMFMFWPDI